jgi:signal transduction histidine kinase
MYRFESLRRWRLPLFPLSLASLLIGAALVPFVLAMGLLGWYGIQLLEAHGRARMQEDIELIARAIRLPLSHALERGHEGTVKRALESAFSIDRVYGVYVYDSKGATIYASGAPDGVMSSERARRIASRQLRQGEFGQVGEDPVFSYFVPLVDAGERVSGLLQVTRRGSDFNQYLSTLRRHGLVLMSVIGVGLVCVLLLGYRWALGRHLGAVEAGLLRIRSGERQHRLEGRGPRELQLLCSSINEMLDAIAHSDAELDRRKARETALTERLHQSRKLAALGQLAAGVAHELGSPLSVLDGQAQRALRQSQLAASVSRSLLGIRREAARMEVIIRQLLDFGRTNPLDRRRVPADRPLRSVVQQLQAAADRADQILFEVVEPLAAIPIEMDRVRLEQALTNLLRNAIQAARSRVRISFGLSDDGVRYCFDDDGSGVPDDLRGHLFEPFFTTKPTGQGTGLGLAVAHAAARDHGGSIEVSASELGGARFCLLLPARDLGQKTEHAND